MDYRRCFLPLNAVTLSILCVLVASPASRPSNIWSPTPRCPIFDFSDPVGVRQLAKRADVLRNACPMNAQNTLGAYNHDALGLGGEFHGFELRVPDCSLCWRYCTLGRITSTRPKEQTKLGDCGRLHRTA
ncbi:hypothetical protein DEU56DRAFT_811160 [Suillus clintonianus]|uniref:uncharacterized protein n=1 Tax=Suillus clintonianus TaxID=1904413 RepID=UPI001B881E81|nr:uncharacterized protein DEU56DRAFT_811160 [Suillus clintonianus]KAG2133343.1 hypothetical protein DEU56DRAFT_811160 [Suillus clintonianus]